ncbi:50S ribosomal protein L18 [Candidatus Wolfebacteria bacterium]|nr:MAG: 50S ribosomal protein L18 [Candidatus Wolfebacteria bacterium]
MHKNIKKEKQARRHAKIRTRVSGTAARPRLCVSKSNTALVAQLIDDDSGKTITSVTTKGMEGKTLGDRSIAAGIKISTEAKEKKVETVVFDRGGYKYTGNVKRFADAARDNGLVF